ncbi:MAG: DNA primase [Gammaproteobacteria bacterium]|nr:DNA primase [Gammaproteobacteria bacterium]
MASNIFDKVLENVDIVDVVKRYVDLVPKGKNLFGICPFHDDHSPSMSVSREKQIYNCFTCHEGGNAIRFIEKYKRISSIEAAKFLAQEYHIDISEFERTSSKSNDFERYYKALDTASRFYQFLMNNQEMSAEAREYLKNRGISAEAIKEFGIGLSVSDDKALIKSLESKGFILSDLTITGLASGEVDTFVDRIMVPIRNEQGRVVAFGGRIYKEKDKGLNKYMNSKETPVFKKGELVFNLDRAVDELKTKNYLIINEGYMDVIQSYSQGVKNAVALMGTAMTNEQAALIKKYTKNVALCLDGDDAGLGAVRSVARVLEENEINYSITILKDNMDPDEYIRKFGVQEYIKEIEVNKLDKLGYIYELIRRKYGTITTFNTESFKNDIFKELKGETSKVQIEKFLNNLSRDLNVSYVSIAQDFDSFMGKINPSYKKNYQVKKAPQTFEVESSLNKAERMILNYAIKDKKFFEIIEERMGSRLFMENKDYRKIYIAIGDIYDELGEVQSDVVVDKLKEKGVYENYEFNDNLIYQDDDLRNNILLTFKKRQVKEVIEEITESLKNNSLDKEERNKLLLELQKKKKELKDYEQKTRKASTGFY